ncbi:phosphocholine-specific phospholipase C [Geothrix limicola]
MAGALPALAQSDSRTDSSSGAGSQALMDSIRRALAIPAHHRRGSLADVEHIVILTQENRSFDHYFGTMRGVRGFGDPRAVRLPSGRSVWHQANGAGEVLPYRPDVPDLGMTFLQDVEHGWNDSHQAWNGGNYDQWIPAKGTSSMAYYTRKDIPFHYALADAFTVCDAYYCSLMGPTDPNRYHMWTGWVGNDGKNGGPVISNAEVGYDWSTYPERLQKAGISWKVYQDIGKGLDANGYWGWTADPFIGNYGDNSLLYFHQYQNALPGTPLADNAKTGTDVSTSGTLIDAFRADVRAGKLPQVSWIAAPEAYSEHPNWPANYGAWFISQFLDALTENPEVWSKTVVFLNYDENGGFFDHMVPPTPPQTAAQGQSTVDTGNEIFPGNPSNPSGPYGLGVRVPMLVISPWSKGGYVDSQVFDHTSLIRFIEARFGAQDPNLIETNITPWRRAVAGDLTSAFNFSRPDASVAPLPDALAYQPQDKLRHLDFVAVPPVVQSLPNQEPGLRPARPLPYALHAHGSLQPSSQTFRIGFENTGQAAAVFQVRSGQTSESPRTYTVEAGKHLEDAWHLGGQATDYNLAVYGPNGFLRAFKGGASQGSAALDVRVGYDLCESALTLAITSLDAHDDRLRITDNYTGTTFKHVLKPGGRLTKPWPSLGHSGWYDLTIKVADDPGFEYHFAGHIETGKDSVSDPALGGLQHEE